MVGREAQQANSHVCLLWYSAMPHGMVGWERKQANSKVAKLAPALLPAQPYRLAPRYTKASKLASLLALV